MEICKNAACTGCGVCADACPQKCISIQYDENGFYRSYVDDRLCVNCHYCIKVCPANHPNKQNPIQKAFKARRTDKMAASQSTSGGIAAALSEYVIRNGGFVAGCGFDDTFCLKHSLASNSDEIENFKGSKYLQSYTVGIYREVRARLQEGSQVLFVGSPCQVSALHNYLGKAYDNLYTVDFVCHGVPSQFVFNKYLESIDSDSAPRSIRFRNKTQGYRNINACSETQIDYSDKTIRNTTETGVYRWFASSLSIRESCYKCPFVSSNRASDLTLADYIGEDLSDTDDENGVNMVFLNSQKGAALLEGIKQDIVLESRDVGAAVKLYDRLMVGSRMPACRSAFFKELPNSDYQSMVDKYTLSKILPSKMARRYYAIKRRIQKFLSDKIRG